MIFRTATKRAFLLLRLILIAQTAHAQLTAPSPPKQEDPNGAGYYGSVFAGPVASLGNAAQGGELVGASFGGLTAHRGLRAVTFPGFDMELGAIGPIQSGKPLDGLFSFNLQPTWITKSRRVFPYMTAGYSRIFVAGNAINFGGGVNLLPKGKEVNHFVRIELRDYYTFASEPQHLVTLRLAFCFVIPDP